MECEVNGCTKLAAVAHPDGRLPGYCNHHHITHGVGTRGYRRCAICEVAITDGVNASPYRDRCAECHEAEVNR